MSTALTETGPRTPSTVIDRGGIQALSVSAMQQRAGLVIEAMANVLVIDKDYGKIPGTDKPTLFKPGAEKLCMMFQLAAERPTIEDIGTGDEIRYRVHVPIAAPDGRVLAVGIGEASSNEEKYRWRKPVCDQEWDEADPAMRREKYFKGGSNGFWKGKQIRTSPADIANTVLKMAHKRGYIHGTLLATAAGSVFNQDLEDFTKELQDSIVEGEAEQRPAARQPQRASVSGGRPPAAAKPAPANALIVVGQVQRVWAGAQGKPAAIILKGSERKYTTFDAAIEKEAKAFEGTDHKVKLAYVEAVKGSTTYYNAVGISIADADPQPAAVAAPESVNPAEFNPFELEPGSQG